MLISDFKGYKKSRWLKDFDKMSIYSIRLDQLEEYIVSIGEKKFRAKQIFDWLYKKRITDFSEMKNVPKSLQEKLAEVGVGQIATVSGRYYAMDRDKRWERVQLAYDAIAHAKGPQFESAQAVIEHSYA